MESSGRYLLPGGMGIDIITDVCMIVPLVYLLVL